MDESAAQDERLFAQKAVRGMFFQLLYTIVGTLWLAVVAIPMVYYYVYVADPGIRGVWYGIVTGNAAAEAISLFWVRKSLSLLIARSVTL
jgi:Na+-driven multidrug efflux pump